MPTPFRLQHILANQIPTALGPILVGPHLSVWFLWLALRLWETIDAHCGYDFPFSPFKLVPFFGGAEQHDFHHKMNVGNYGMLTCVTGWWSVCLSFWGTISVGCWVVGQPDR